MPEEPVQKHGVGSVSSTIKPRYLTFVQEDNRAITCLRETPRIARQSGTALAASEDRGRVFYVIHCDAIEAMCSCVDLC